MTQSEFDAGDGQTIVLYRPIDTGQELEPELLFAEVAEDSGRRAASGQRVVSMAWTPLRHAGAMFGNDGSGYATKAAVAVVYGPSANR
jgi:hypothetical protein